MLSEWAQIAIALFTAVTALAALLSVRRVEQDRRARLIPELHIEILCDIPNNEMRLTVVNLGAPAREVRVMGTVGDFGFFHPTPPTTYWQEGESRTYRISMPVLPGVEAQAFVEARDLGRNTSSSPRLAVRPTAGTFARPKSSAPLRSGGSYFRTIRCRPMSSTRRWRSSLSSATAERRSSTTAEGAARRQR